MNLHPMDLGAQCSRCSLFSTSAFNPVFAELRQGAPLTIVAEAPGKSEVASGFPLVGQSGKEMMSAFTRYGWTRENLSITNCCLCRPHKNDMNEHLRLLRRRNNAREKRGEQLLLAPMVACWPRLLVELHQARCLFLLGKFARSAVYANRIRTEEEMSEEEKSAKRGAGKEGEDSFMAARGYPDEITLPDIPDLGWPARRVPVISTIHPAFALRQRRWTIPFTWDVGKATRLAMGGMRPLQTQVHLFPSIEQVGNFLEWVENCGLPPTYDVETEVRGSWVGDHVLRCIGIGNYREVMVVPYRTVEHRPCWSYSRYEQDLRDSMMREFFSRKGRPIVDQNGIYDWLACQFNIPGFEMKRDRFDTVIAHHVAFPEFPHNLGFQTAQYTDNRAHKDVDHDKWEYDRELHLYNGMDVGTTSWNAECLKREPTFTEQGKVFETDMFLSAFCKEMQEIGIKMDLGARALLYKRLTESANNHLKEVHVLAQEAVQERGWTKERGQLAKYLNPQSTKQMGAFLFDVMGIQPVPAKEGGYTNEGEPSVSKTILFSLMDRGLSETVEKLLLAVIDYREDMKLRGTYCEVEPARDGRVHPTWNPHVVPSGRLSCSKPNVQNLKSSIKILYIAEPGHVFVIWDYSQLEARTGALMSGQEDQINVFLTGGDIHCVNACAVLGIDDPSDVTPKQRQFTKTMVYAAQYLASFNTVFRLIRNFRDKDGDRPYRNLSSEAVHVMFTRFWERRAAIMGWNENNRRIHREVGYLADPLLGRRHYFLDYPLMDEGKELKANYLSQCMGASIVNQRTKLLRDRFPLGFAGENTGIVQQGHDAITIECPEDMAEEVAREGARILTTEFGGMPFPVDCHIGYSLGRLEEYTVI